MKKTVKCTSHLLTVTKDKCYQVIKESGNDYLIVNDYGNERYYNICHFEVVSSAKVLKETEDNIKAEIETVSKHLENLRKDLVKVRIEIKKKSPKVGDRYNHEDGGEYMIAQCDHESYCLVNLSDGNRWTNSVKDINDVFAGDQDEFIKIN